jgi:hypothetical protein
VFLTGEWLYLLFRSVLMLASGALFGYVLGELTVWLVKHKMATAEARVVILGELLFWSLVGVLVFYFAWFGRWVICP